MVCKCGRLVQECHGNLRLYKSCVLIRDAQGFNAWLSVTEGEVGPIKLV